MLPINLVPVFCPLSPSDIVTSEQDSAININSQDNLFKLEKMVLSAGHYAGHAKNTLLEENDRHLKEGLFCAVKIEALMRVMNELVEQEKISAADLHMLIEDKKLQITPHLQQIWVNQLTLEKSWPLFYSLEE